MVTKSPTLYLKPNVFNFNKYSNGSPVYTFTVSSTIHHDSPRFLMVRKIGMDRGESWRKSGNIQYHYDSSENVHGITTVSVRSLYESMTIHDGNATVNED